MKRYVRTEEGYIIDTENTQPFMIKNYMGSKYIDFNSMGTFKIKSTGDTIEELCDCFVDYCEEDDSHFISDEDPLRRYGHEIYGAIWFKFGLSFVAKLNIDTGEYELL